VAGNTWEVGAVVMRMRGLHRAFGAAAVATALLVSGASSALAAEKDVHGTIVETHDSKEEWVILTSSLTGREQPITIDMSRMSDTFARHKVGEPIHIIVQERESNTYRALALVSEGSYVEGENLGVQERYEVKEDSIKAHVGNSPDDDEALNQDHRNSNLRQNQEEAKGSGGPNASK
jgi:hypothetical protein